MPIITFNQAANFPSYLPCFFSRLKHTAAACASASYTLRQPPPDTAVEEQLRMLREDIAVGLNDILAARCNPLSTEPHYQVISQPTSPASNTSTGASDTAANGQTSVVSQLPVTDLQSLDELEKSLQQREKFHALVIDKKLKFCFGSLHIV
jgi:hypothetical protein